MILVVNLINRIKGSLGSLFFTLILILNTGCSKNVELVLIKGQTMGTSYNIKYVKRDKTPSYKEVKVRVDRFLVKYNQSLSTYLPNSTISIFNRTPVGSEIEIDKWFKDMIIISKDINKKSDGYFDPSIGKLITLWGFGAKKKTTKPTKEKINNVLKDIGIEKAVIKKGTIKEKFLTQRPSDNFTLNFSAIAKGHAVELVSIMLEKEFDIRDSMVEIGGEIQVRSFKKDNWNLAIESPSENSRSIHKIIPLQNGAVATSGNYRNFYEENGKKIGHTISPFNGRPFISNLVSASVVNESCARADAWATAFMAMGSEKALEIANIYGIKAFFIINNKGKLDTLKTDAWDF